MKNRTLWIGVAALVLLPFAVHALGLSTNTATQIVCLAIAALGIRLAPYMAAIVMLGVAMAALGGALFAPITVVHPAMGAEIITVAFVVVVIGGLGSFWGVVLSALLVGVVRGITIHFAPAAGEASMYVLMFLVLMFRPRGLLGERIDKFE